MTDSGDLWLFVDGEAMVHIQGAVPMKDLPFLHPVVDVFAHTKVVTLLPEALPPPSPWEVRCG